MLSAKDLLPFANNTFPPNEAGCIDNNTDYIANGTTCVCHLAWKGQYCETAVPYIPRLLLSLQIIYSVTLAVMVVVTLLLFIVALKEKGKRKSYASLICGSILLALLSTAYFFHIPSKLPTT